MTAEAKFSIRAQDRTQGAFGSVNKQLSRFQNGVRKLNMGMIGGVAGGAAFVRYGAQALQAADEIDNLSKQLGLGVESLQSMKVLMEEAGMSVTGLQTAMNGLVNFQAEAIQGSKKYQKAFEDMGVTFEELRQLSPEQLLERIGRALADGEGDADVMAGAVDILGGRSVKLQEVLKQLGREGFGNLNKAMLESGRIMSEDLVRSSDLMEEKLDRAMRRMKVKRDTFMGKGMSGMYIAGQGFMENLGNMFQADEDKSAFGKALQIYGQMLTLNAFDKTGYLNAGRELFGDSSGSGVDGLGGAAPGGAGAAAGADTSALDERIQQLGWKLDNLPGSFGASSFGTMRGLNRTAQRTLDERQKKKLDEDRNRILEEIAEATKERDGMLVITE